MTRVPRYPASLRRAALAFLLCVGMLSSAAPLRGQDRAAKDAPAVKTINLKTGLHRLGHKTGYKFTLELFLYTHRVGRLWQIPEPSFDAFINAWNVVDT